MRRPFIALVQLWCEKTGLSQKNAGSVPRNAWKKPSWKRPCMVEALARRRLVAGARVRGQKERSGRYSYHPDRGSSPVPGCAVRLRGPRRRFSAACVGPTHPARTCGAQALRPTGHPPGWGKSYSACLDHLLRLDAGHPECAHESGAPSRALGPMGCFHETRPRSRPRPDPGAGVEPPPDLPGSGGSSLDVGSELSRLARRGQPRARKHAQAAVITATSKSHRAPAGAARPALLRGCGARRADDVAHVAGQHGEAALDT